MTKLNVHSWQIPEPRYPLTNACDLCESVGDILTFLNCEIIEKNGYIYLNRFSSELLVPKNQFWINSIFVSSLITYSPESEASNVDQAFDKLCKALEISLIKKIDAFAPSEKHKVIKSIDDEYDEVAFSVIRVVD
ncbi:hypothetical protein [Hirschia litorea]|uniref:DUF3168 domain-containing protein n=1 Tax=Hirschia litorea TaxID=1199156 RepID=A0ABW2IQ10_9PROT